jgi:hypothetical protein
MAAAVITLLAILCLRETSRITLGDEAVGGDLAPAARAG